MASFFMLRSWSMASAFLLLVVSCCLAANDRPDDLLAGVKPQFSLAAEKVPKWQDRLPRLVSGHTQIRARWTFALPGQKDCVSLSLRTSVLVELCQLNGSTVPPPLKGMRYLTLPGISPNLLKLGENALEIEFGLSGKKAPATDAKSSSPFEVALVCLAADDINFQTQPVLGDAGADYFSVACRTNMPAEVELEVDGKKSVSPTGLIHSFRPANLQPSTLYDYMLTARVAGSQMSKRIGPFKVSTLPPVGGNLTFVALGDSRSHPKDWARVAAAVFQKKPLLTVFSGDMVYDGRNDDQWDTEFFGMAPAYFASIPAFYVPGNHEAGTPIVGTLLPMAGRDRWKAVVGSALFIGIDGGLSWNAESENLKWLEGALKASREKFIFLSSHYSPWSSGAHGALSERPSIEARKFILPMMKKYGATAFLAGHDHDYERSEPPSDVTVIVSGGAGAPLYGRTYLPGQNPHSKIFIAVHHFCLFAIEGDRCTMQALTPEGKLLDTRSWIARKVK